MSVISLLGSRSGEYIGQLERSLSQHMVQMGAPRAVERNMRRMVVCFIFRVKFGMCN
jgi:hypothetical protein